MGLSNELLFAKVLETTIRRAPATLDLHARVQSEGFASTGERLASLRINAGAGPIIDAAGGGFLVRTADAQAFLTVLEEHPVFSGDGRLDVGYPVIGAEGAHLESLRAEAAELLLLGGLALSQAKQPIDRHLAALIQVVLSADPHSNLIRDVLLGKPIPDLGTTFHIPKDLLDLAEQLDRRSCELGLSHAVNEWGGALAGSRATSWATGITSLSPNHGCGGDIVAIHGAGFGAKQLADVSVWFPRLGGGCVAVRVISWSDSLIMVETSASVGVGCVGFVQANASAGGSLAEAASTLAGEMVRCIGMPAFNAAGRIEQLGRHPLLECPPCLPNGANKFTGGKPRILRFAGNGKTDVEIAPAMDLLLDWDVANAASIAIVSISDPSGPNEQPDVYGPLSPTTGTFLFLAVSGSFTWDRDYELRAWNSCTPANAPITARITVRMRSHPDLKIYGIEAIQATQFFDSSIHMMNSKQWQPDNSVPLIALKPTVARVFVDSGQRSGFDRGKVSGVSGQLFGFDAQGNALPGSPLDPLNASFIPSPGVRIVAERRAAAAGLVAARRMLPPDSTFLFLLPPTWTAAAEISVRAAVKLPPGQPETSTGNNTRQQRLIFNNAGFPLRLAVLPVSFSDPGTGALIPPPNAFQIVAETDQLQRVLPSRRGLLSVVLAPGGANPWNYAGNLAAPGISCGKGFNEILIELATRAFFTLGMEDRVWVALLDTARIAPGGPTLPVGGCGSPMGAMGVAWISGGALGGLLLGPLVPIVITRLGTCALGVAASGVSAPAAPPALGSGTRVGTLAQEVGHGLGLFHVPDGVAPPPTESGWPDYELGNPMGSIGEFGLEIDDLMGMPPVLRAYQPRSFLPSLPGESTDFMGYAGSTDWVSPFIYQKLTGVRATPSPSTPSPGPSPRPATHASARTAPEHAHDRRADFSESHDAHEHRHQGELIDLDLDIEVPASEVLLVRGAVLEGGVALYPAFVQTKRIRFAELEGSPYQLVLLNRDGKVLERNAIVPIAEQHTGTPRPDFLFALALPWHDDASQIVVRLDGKDLAFLDIADKPAELSPPTIKVSKEEIVARWKSDHADARNLRYLVRFARDEQRAWQFVAADLTQPEIRIPLRSLPNAKEGRVQIAATVGGRTTWVESEPFAVQGGMPELVLLSPREGAWLQWGTEVDLRMQALSMDSEPASEESIKWHSDRDGEIGTGAQTTARLSLGEHEISVTLRVVDGRVARVSSMVNVVARTAPEPD